MLRFYVGLFLFFSSVSLFGYSVEDVLRFKKSYAPLAVKQMQEYDIPASIILAQAFLESRHGTSELARDYNNFFGIKSKSDWSGSSVRMKSAEYKRGNKFYKPSDFRYYSTPEDSWRDHSEFLSSRPRYRRLFEKGVLNYRGWAKGLQKAGYATDPKYAKKLIRLIERHHFYDFDRVAFRLKHNLPLDIESFHPDNREAIAYIQAMYLPDTNQLVSEKALLRQEAQRRREIVAKINFDPQPGNEPATEADTPEEALPSQFQVYLSEEEAPIIRDVIIKEVSQPHTKM